MRKYRAWSSQMISSCDILGVSPTCTGRSMFSPTSSHKRVGICSKTLGVMRYDDRRGGSRTSGSISCLWCLLLCTASVHVLYPHVGLRFARNSSMHAEGLHKCEALLINQTSVTVALSVDHGRSVRFCVVLGRAHQCGHGRRVCAHCMLITSSI